MILTWHFSLGFDQHLCISTTNYLLSCKGVPVRRWLINNIASEQIISRLRPSCKNSMTISYRFVNDHPRCQPACRISTTEWPLYHVPDYMGKKTPIACHFRRGLTKGFRTVNRYFVTLRLNTQVLPQFIAWCRGSAHVNRLCQQRLG